MSTKSYLLAALALIAGLGGGVAYERFGPLTGEHGEAATAKEKTILYWVAPMDPNYRRDAPGKSPMGMDLIPVYDGEQATTDAPADSDAVQLSPAVINAIGVRVGAVAQGAFGENIRTVGYVALDEDRTSHVHVRKEGWIEGLKIRSVGAEVDRNQLLFEFFSPELASASWEYVRELERGSNGMTVGARAKLKALGVDDRQINDIRSSGKPAERIRVYAPQNGVLIQLNVGEGMYIRPDQTLMVLSDLSSVWVIADVFESEGGMITPGMEAEAHLDYQHGRTWRGTVDYIYPELDPVTRTLRVRLRFNNADLALRPNMFANVTFKRAQRNNVLTVPSEAVIRTGQSDRVVVALGDGRFKPVEVTVGAQSDGQTEIVRGLAKGDKIVLSGQFLIDSESSLTAGFARMSPPKDETPPIAPLAETKATIKAIDGQKRILTVSHGPIPALGWPPMTMDFALTKGIDLKDLHDDQSITISIGRDDSGAFVILSLKPAMETMQ
jgi:Cu(I)/Ag(I) efflux system membrane fusion protein